MSKNVVKKVTEIDVWGNLEKIRGLFAPDLTKDEFMFFVGLGKSMNANPFKREIWAVKYDQKKAAQIFLSRDFYRKTAQNQESYDGHYPLSVYKNDTWDFDPLTGMPIHNFDVTTDRGELKGAYCLAWRKGIERPFFVYVKFDEVTKKQSTWLSQPVTQVEKVAEARCLRMTWQDIFGGTYSEAEQGIIEANIIEDTKYKGEPPVLKTIKEKKEQKKETKKEELKPDKNGKNYKALIKETLEGMFAGDQDMIDRKLISLTSFEITDKKTGEVKKVKGSWDLEKMSTEQSQVIWHKLEREIEARDNAEVEY